MEYLGSWFNSNNSPQKNYSKQDFDNDVQQISNFPENGNAQIKVVGNRLSRTDEGYVNWGYGYMWGTTLDGTVSHIRDCVLGKSEEKFNRDYQALEDKLQSSDFKTKEFRAKLKKLEKDLIQDLKLLDGMERITQTYLSRYAQTSHKGIEELQGVHRNLADRVQGEMTKYLELVELFKNRQNQVDLSQSVLMIDKDFLKPPISSPQGDLEAYCYQYNRDIHPNEATILIYQGKELINGILAGKITTVSSDPLEAEQQITALTWALMEHALKHNQGYDEGTFAIKDSANALYSFLRTHPKCYNRPSTHYVGRSPKSHHGVDVFSNQMPAHKRTLLFELITQQDGSPLLFIKPENFSADPTIPYDLVMHGYEVIMAQYNKVFYPGSDDLPNMRKERVPVETLKAFEEILKQLEENDFRKMNAELFRNPIFHTENPMKEAKLYGIAFMKAYVDAIPELGIFPASLDMTRFNHSLKGLDHLDQRTGREVFIESF